MLEASGRRSTPPNVKPYTTISAARGAPPERPEEGVSGRPRRANPRISLATVYKALEALVSSGLAAKLTASDGSARYDARQDHHYHLRCLHTGAVEDLPTPYDPDLITKIDPALVQDLEQKGFRVTGYRLELVGYFNDGAGTRG